MPKVMIWIDHDNKLSYGVITKGTVCPIPDARIVEVKESILSRWSKAGIYRESVQNQLFHLLYKEE